MTQNRQVFWTGKAPARCDITQEPITNRFIDGATRMGPWANMTPKSHKQYGIGLGTGRGQLFEKQPDGRWLKIEG